MLTLDQQAAWDDAISQSKRAVPMRQVLEMLGWRTYHGKRADCGRCEGDQRGTISFSDGKGLWHCFRCDQGGDVLSLVMAAHGCNFRAALEFLAARASVQLPSPRNREEARRLHCECERRKQHREQVDRICDDFEAQERQLRLECRSRIHQCDDLLAAAGPWTEAHWDLASACHELLHEYLLPEYVLLAFGAVEQRMKYARANELERIAMSTAVRRAGGVRTDDEKWVEAMQ